MSDPTELTKLLDPETATMAKHEQATQRQEVEAATRDMSDRDRALFSLGYSLASRHSLQAMNATLTVIKNSVPHIFVRPATVRK